MGLFVRYAQERRGEEIVSRAVSTAIGSHVGWTGKWQAIKALERRVRGTASDSGVMRTIRDRLKGAVKYVAPKRQRRREG